MWHKTRVRCDFMPNLTSISDSPSSKTFIHAFSIDKKRSGRYFLMSLQEGPYYILKGCPIFLKILQKEALFQRGPYFREGAYFRGYTVYPKKECHSVNAPNFNLNSEFIPEYAEFVRPQSRARSRRSLVLSSLHIGGCSLAWSHAYRRRRHRAFYCDIYSIW